MLNVKNRLPRVSSNPVQPFQVRYMATLSQLQSHTLLQFYQPLIGSAAISVYMTLMSFTERPNCWGQRYIHAQILQVLNMSPDNYNEARAKLEAVNLLKTYREKNDDLKADRHLLLYDIQQPLEVTQFTQHPYLSTSLYNQIGDVAYYQLIKQLAVEEIDYAQFSEITTPFSSMFDFPDNDTIQLVQEGAKERLLRQQLAQNTFVMDDQDFDYERLCRYLMAEGIKASELTFELKQHVLAIKETYQFDESQMLKIVLLSINALSNKIELDQLKVVADRQKHYASRQNNTENLRDVVQPSQHGQSTVDVNRLVQQLKKQYPIFTQDDIDLVVLAEKLPNNVFLEKIKTAKSGFVTDSEWYYFNNVANKTTLLPSILNILIYDLLIFRERETLYKADLERTANEWQQQKLQTPADVLHYIKQKEKTQLMKQEQQAKQSAYKSYHQSKRTEIVPTWMKNVQSGATDEVQNVDQRQTHLANIDDQDLQKALDDLMGGGK